MISAFLQVLEMGGIFSILEMKKINFREFYYLAAAHRVGSRVGIWGQVFVLSKLVLSKLLHWGCKESAFVQLLESSVQCSLLPSW